MNQIPNTQYLVLQRDLSTNALELVPDPVRSGHEVNPRKRQYSEHDSQTGNKNNLKHFSGSSRCSTSTKALTPNTQALTPNTQHPTPNPVS